ncbi:glycosyltransferase involved in cell wall biosynthesis [Bradyrhizobium sp. USDA 336]
MLFLSRIHPKKGCDILIEAFAKLATHDPELQLVMAGPDQIGMKANLATRAAQLGIADRVHWTGMLKGDEKWGAFHACEAFVLPSHSENFGIVVAEALACGKPVLITNKINIWREIEQDGAGLVANDTEEGITKLLKDFSKLRPERREQIGKAARQLFLNRFDLRKNQSRLLELILDTQQPTIK